MSRGQIHSPSTDYTDRLAVLVKRGKRAPHFFFAGFALGALLAFLASKGKGD